MTEDENTAVRDEREVSAELEALRRENALLRLRTARLERWLGSTTPLIVQVTRLAFWDFTPYDVSPDDSWVAVDRDKAMALMAALADVDHWNPWNTTIEPRPQP